jgi:2'-deoxynucleoside 5'-phosphate N-hydrolase
MRIFFAGPLTTLLNPDKTKLMYKKMGDIAQKNGFQYFWAFQSGTDPVKNPDVEPEFIYYKDLFELENSNMVIAYVGEPTTGTGLELEYAKEHGIPAFLFYQKDQTVSRMIVGNPSVEEVIAYENAEDALYKLDELLQRIRSKTKTATTNDSELIHLKEE